jgi:hypothetical protein
MDRLLFVLTFLSALGAGLIGGLFFAFSSFVMIALGRLPPASGISAMQSINVAESGVLPCLLRDGRSLYSGIDCRTYQVVGASRRLHSSWKSRRH